MNYTGEIKNIKNIIEVLQHDIKNFETSDNKKYWIKALIYDKHKLEEQLIYLLNSEG